MRLGVTMNIKNYETIRLESNEWETSYDCAMELINEVKKLDNFEATKYAMSYLAPFIENREIYKPTKSSLIEKILKWIKNKKRW